MSDTISRQAAIDAIACDITVTGRNNAEIVARTIGTFVDRIKALPPAQPQPKIIDDGDAVTILSRNTPYSFYLWAVIADMLKRCGLAFCEREVEQ